MRAMIFGTAALLLLAGCAESRQHASMPADVRVANAGGAPVLADAREMTLYTFDRDTTPGKSACNGQCAHNWPPLTAAAGAMPAGPWTVVTRDDGSRQWAYKGKPLYTWIKDQKPRETSGDGVNNAWHVAKP